SGTISAAASGQHDVEPPHVFDAHTLTADYPIDGPPVAVHQLALLLPSAILNHRSCTRYRSSAGPSIDGSNTEALKQVGELSWLLQKRRLTLLMGTPLDTMRTEKPSGQREKWKTTSLLVIGSGTA